MNRPIATFITLAFCLWPLTFPLSAQRAIKGTGSGGSTGVGIAAPPRAKPKTITYTALTPLRQWTNSDGNTMVAHLLAHDPQGAAQETATPQDPKAAPVILREDKVRFLKEKKVFELPLTSLSAPDQDYIKAIIAANRQAPPAK